MRLLFVVVVLFLLLNEEAEPAMSLYIKIKEALHKAGGTRNE